MIYYSIPLLLILSALALITGACVGSFLNCLAYRLGRGESVLKGRSHCDSCGHTLGALDLIPIFSYIFCGGKCRYCKAKLSAGHILAELITALGFLGVLLRYDFTFETVIGMAFTAVLMAVSLTDLYSYTIPDGFILFGALIRIIYIFTLNNRWAVLLSSLIGGFAVAGAVLLIVIIFEKIKKTEAMGGGDIKLIFLCGLYLGWQKNILCLLLSCIIGIIFGFFALKRNAGNDGSAVGESGGELSPLFPWGPSIAAAAWLSYIFGDYLVAAYLTLISA